MHGNIAAVRQMRAVESNEFDAVIVAGDIGSASASAILEILATFECPVLYVYGNRDIELEYNHDFGPARHHLHLAPLQIGDWAIVGFSGCPTAWGKNPIAARFRGETEGRHRKTIEAAAQEEEALNAKVEQAREECERFIAQVKSEAVGRKRKLSQRRIGSAIAGRDGLIATFQKQKDALMQTRAYKAYQDDLAAAWDRTLSENRRALAAVVAESHLTPGRTIVVTHERLRRAAVQFFGVPLFVFGHLHAFADTVFKGARYLNVAALDKPILVEPIPGIVIPRSMIVESEDDFYRRTKWRNLNAGGYVKVIWTLAQGHQATWIQLPQISEWGRYWRQVVGYHDPGAPMLPLLA
jgi:hypothetical protein